MNSPPRFDPIDLHGRRIFLTGGTGFLGRCLLDYFLESARTRSPAFEITVLSRRSGEYFLSRHARYAGQSWLRFHEGSLDRLPTSQAHQFTDVLHAAADTHSSADPLAWLDQLVQGTRNVLDFALGCRAERFLLVSSGAAYGPMPEGVARLSEDAPLAPSTTDVRSVYGQGKRLAEHLCALYGHQHGLACVVARCFALISEHMPLNGPYAAGNFLRDALEGRELEILGDGSVVRTYLHGRDAAHWLVSLLRHGKPNEIYNVGSDVPVSILELARAIATQVSPPLGVQVAKKVVAGPSATYVPDIHKAGQLGLRVTTPLVEAITMTLQALQRTTA